MTQPILLQAAADGGGMTQTLIMMGLIMVVFYFFMIRPQMKKSKEEKAFREGLQKGDKIVTIGGIHGKILEVRDTNVIIETEGGGRLKLEKSGISKDGSAGINQGQ